MKKQKRQRETSAAAAQAAAIPRKSPWWPWAVTAVVALLIALEAYGPALNGAFVLDDLSQYYMSPSAAGVPFSAVIHGTRPLLMVSYWINYQMSETNPGSYHAINVLLHWLTSILFAFVAARLLAWAGVEGLKRNLLAAFAGALFLLHPLQTESVAYVSSRSEVLSVMLFLAAYALFLYQSDQPPTIGRDVTRSVAIVALFAAAVLTKEHTAMLPILVILTDLFWRRGGFARNRVLYGIFVLGAAFGAYVVAQVLRGASTVGFGLKTLTPATYFFTQCRVIWNYLRMFVLPFGQNADPDVPISHTLIDHGAVIGLVALIALVAAAWIYRKRFPLASFGVFVSLLLFAPTSSFMPIDDVQAERRLYLPFLGLALIVLELLRRLEWKKIAGVGAAILVICSILTYQRSEVWAGPLELWTDTVAKSPAKWRPRFQLARVYYDSGQCPTAAATYEQASKLGPQTYDLLIDWALALDCAGRAGDAIPIAEQAAKLENTAHAHAVLGMLYARKGDTQTAMDQLDRAEKINPHFEITYIYRGKVDEMKGDRAAAAQEYRKVLSFNPSSQLARDALAGLAR